MIAFALVALLLSCCGCAVAVALTLRVRQVLAGAEVRAPRGTDVQAGATVPDDLDLTDLDGAPWRAPTGGGEPWLLTFMSLDCGGCKEQLPRYVRYLRRNAIPPERAVSVVIGDEVTRGSVPAELLRFTRVLPASATSPLVARLKVSSWPTYLVVGGDGTVSYATQSVSRLMAIDPRRPAPSAPEPAPA
ncbi:hypothetical protein [Streptomyces sp. NPDC005865]|uniref:hypothetical protein n=1 Tax=Streptomyces sp. NPDC005865 TaxID=3155453 RepID=UPI0034035427